MSKEKIMVKNMVLVKLDFHESLHTEAKTWWDIVTSHGELKTLDEVGKKIWSNKDPKKTHWDEYWLIPSGSVLVRNRISNRGNYWSGAYTPLEMKAEWDEIPPEYRL